MAVWRGTITRRPDIAAAILSVGAVLYLVICIPAIEQRGYPPIDPIWGGVTYLWIVFIPLSAVFDRPKGWGRWRSLIIYALVTAFIDAGTMVLVVPRHVDLLFMLVGTIVFGPLHIVVTAIVEGASQLVLSHVRHLQDEGDASSDPIRRRAVGLWVFMLALLALTVAFPIGYRHLAIESAYFSGRKAADRDWDAQQTAIRAWDYPEVVRGQGVTVSYRIDEVTSLRLRLRADDIGFSAGYNERVQERVAAEGIPHWSLRNKWIEPDRLAEMLTSGQLHEVKDVPLDVTRGIVVFRQGTVSRWGGTFSSTSEGLSIGTKDHALYGTGNSRKPIYVGRDPKNQAVVLIRQGTDWIGAFDEEGHLIATASCDLP